MKAMRLAALRTMELIEIPAPSLQNDDDVLLRIATVGVCGSDMHYYRSGRIGDHLIEFPLIIGHECAATVEAVGCDAGGIKVGDRVAIDPLIACGKCDQCLTGREHTCRDQAFMGCPGQIEGALAEFVVMPARCCFPLPDNMTMTQAVMIEPFSIALHAAVIAGKLSERNMAILGCGPIGLCVLKAARQAGTGKIYATDLLDNRLALALSCGADWIANAGSQDIVAAIGEYEPAGVDLVFKCAGQQETLDQAMELLKPGGVLVMVGIPESPRVSFDMDQLRRSELSIRCVRRQNECVAPAIDLVASGKIVLDDLVTHTFDLTETAHAFDMVADYKDNVVKAMINV